MSWIAQTLVTIHCICYNFLFPQFSQPCLLNLSGYLAFFFIQVHTTEIQVWCISVFLLVNVWQNKLIPLKRSSRSDMVWSCVINAALMGQQGLWVTAWHNHSVTWQLPQQDTAVTARVSSWKWQHKAFKIKTSSPRRCHYIYVPPVQQVSWLT